MTITDIMTGVTRPMTADELGDRRDLKRWRFRLAVFYILILIVCVAVFVGGYWVRETGWLS